MSIIKSAHGYLRHFDGQDYLWAESRERAWVLKGYEATLHFNRVYWEPCAELVELKEDG